MSQLKVLERFEIERAAGSELDAIAAHWYAIKRREPSESDHDFRVKVLHCFDRLAFTHRLDKVEADRAINRANALDKINPAHYRSDPSGIECIEVTRHRNFNIGCAIKYLWRAGLKDVSPTVEDLKKAVWYIQDEIGRLEGSGDHAGQAESRAFTVVGRAGGHIEKGEIVFLHSPQAFADRANERPGLNELVRCDVCECEFRPAITKVCLECGSRHGRYIEPAALVNVLYSASEGVRRV